ncbi:V-type ATPase 116kDa subunit family-domain-containing protein [Mycena rebaudengoi]|nr:V-type ATPase 116kDa subunit family-domain-containing protein [Mycena rebaudengoi]
MNKRAAVDGTREPIFFSGVQFDLENTHGRSIPPPILHKLHPADFTLGFQTIVDSYGIATYQEVNPGLFAVVTFPFLFAVIGLMMSVVLGVIHMTFALCLQVPNHLRFKRPIDIYLNFIPQMIFLQSIFGHLVVCILYKWSIDWSTSATAPPSLLNMLISMFLTPRTVDPATQLFPGQGAVQTVLLLHGNGGAIVEDADDEEHEQHYFGEVVIRQVIHTIEFCLGCFSRTASYLRLWALSLAHAVLWSMTIEGSPGLASIEGWIKLVLTGSLWFGCSVGILCLMEGLSAFLHALRLHWVEANSKHYEGGGYSCICATDFCEGLRW